MTPTVSILIPNFNNGRASSISGQMDMIGDLLTSLHDTLADEPTPCEIIVCDDGSTDDSLPTLRAWKQRAWPEGRPFIELMEVAHTGKLSGNANLMYRKARGAFFVRLDGDIVCLTRHWATRLVEYFRQGPPRLGILAPKQLGIDGNIHAYGDFILHPSGYTHVAQGLPRDAVKYPMEVDHAMGCFHVCRREVYEEIGGYDESFYRSETEDFGIAAQTRGWRCLAVPDIEFVHRHKLRKGRASVYDDTGCILRDLQHYEDKWGFSRIAPDLKAVRQRYAGQALLWNKRVFPDTPPTMPGPAGTLKFEDSCWPKYLNDLTYRAGIDFRLKVVGSILQQFGKPRLLAHLGCAAGLLTHLLAGAGLSVVGMDPHQANLDLAQRCVQGRKYPADAPRFVRQDDLDRIPLADAGTELLLLTDYIERHPNPVALYRDARRVLKPGGLLLVISPKPTPDRSATLDPSAPAALAQPMCPHYYLTEAQMSNQVGAMGGWDVAQTAINAPETPAFIVVARRV